MLRMRVESERVMWWLSTLGGAWSALGEYSRAAVDRAAETSLRQLALAERMGDAVLAARCRVFVALALIQYGNFRPAAAIIRFPPPASPLVPAPVQGWWPFEGASSVRGSAWAAASSRMPASASGPSCGWNGPGPKLPSPRVGTLGTAKMNLSFTKPIQHEHPKNLSTTLSIGCDPSAMQTGPRLSYCSSLISPIGPAC